VREIFRRDIPGDESRESWTRAFYTAAHRTGRLFRQENGGGLVYIDPSFGCRHIFTSHEFYGIAHNLVEVVEMRRRGRDEELVAVPALMTPYEVSTIFDSPEKVLLPALRAVVFAPVAVPEGDSCRIIGPGYDAASGYFYYISPGTAPIQPREGVEHLSKALSGVPFERPAYRANMVAWLLGAMSTDPAMQTPFLVCDGNQQGVGKTSLVQAAGYILSGGLPSPVDPRGQEFWKQLSARFMEQDRLIFLDNITNSRGGSYDNEQLSGLLTQGTSKRIRILGQSKSVSAAGVLFAASLNDAKLSADLSERSLLVRLFREKNQPMVPYVKEYAVEHRREIYGELLWLATQPAQPVPDAVHPNFRFRRWLNFALPRVEKYFGPLGIDEAKSLDDATQELFAWGSDNIGTQFYTANFLSATQSQPERYPCLYQRVANCASDKGKQISMGRLLASHIGEVHTIQGSLKVKLTALPKDDAGSRYQFVDVK